MYTRRGEEKAKGAPWSSTWETLASLGVPRTTTLSEVSDRTKFYRTGTTPSN